MPVETTMYIHEKTVDQINEACALCGSTRNAMIVHLMKYAMADMSRMIRTGCGVRYQSNDLADKWHTVHVRFREDEADFVKDLRNFFKLSASLILAMAVRDYLKAIVKKSKTGDWTDNYHFSNYLLSREVVDGLIQWRICWGYPKKGVKTLRL